jgi:hypothetical protein
MVIKLFISKSQAIKAPMFVVIILARKPPNL